MPPPFLPGRKHTTLAQMVCCLVRKKIPTIQHGTMAN